MRRTLVFALFITFIACNKEQITQEDQKYNWTAEEIDNFIIEAMGTSEIWDWAQGDSEMLYSAMMLSDSILSIGFSVDGQNVESDLGTARWKTQDMIAKRDALINEVLEMERAYLNDPLLTTENILPFGRDADIPSIAIRVTNPAIIPAMRNRIDIRYVEPLGYYFQSVVSGRSGSGCQGSPNYNINSNDYETMAPGTKKPWNFDNHGVESAWGCSQGDNIGICVIDSGASDYQDNLGSQFTSGYSGGRTVTKLSTLYSGWWWWKNVRFST